MATLKNDYLSGETTKTQYIEHMWAYHSSLLEYADFIERTDIKSLLITDGRVQAEFKSFPISLNVPKSDRRTPPIEAINFGVYEAEYSQKMLSMLKNCRVFFDIGANIGYYSIAAGILHPSAQVFAFEPTPATYLELVSNIKLNDARNIKPIQVALSDVSGESLIFYDEKESGASSFCNIRDSADALTLSVQTKTLDSFVEERGVCPDFIKCDVEGAELSVLRGSKEVLENYHPIIFIEILRKWCRTFGHEANDVVDYLKSLDYVPHILKKDQLVSIEGIDDEMEDTNFVFLSERGKGL